MRSSVLVLAFAAAWSFSARDAFATEGITGYSGKPYNGVSQTCLLCHGGGGAAPTVNITIPTTMKAGDTAEVTIVINGTRTRTSMNAAFSAPVVATKGQNTDVPFPVQTPDEVAAVAPPPNGASGTYKFSFVAPNANGPLTMYLAAMSASGAGTGGDGVAVTTRTITITGATGGGTTDGGTTGDGGTGGTTHDGGTGGTTGDGGTGGTGGGGGGGGGGATGDGGHGSTTPGLDGGDAPSEGEDEDPGSIRSGSSGGCSVTRENRSDGAVGLVFAAALALIASKRRRR